MTGERTADAGPRGRGAVWRYLLVGAGTALLAVPRALDLAAGSSVPVQDLVALGAGAAAVALLPQRHRRPPAVAVACLALLVVSDVALPSTLLAVASVGTWRRTRWTVTTAVGVAGAVAAQQLLVGSDLSGAVPSADLATRVLLVVVGVLLFGTALVGGYYTGARRELLASLRERAAAAEREAAARAEGAREAERLRIAREMHDVLAHRISLVSMHAGVLAFRRDLPPEQVAEVAAVVRDNANLALEELRDVLGVLRRGPGADPDAAAEAPQPSLDEVPALVAEVRETGQQVALEVDVTGSAVPATLGRTVYRVVQEAVTNARKHADGGVLRVRVAGGPGAGVDVRAENPVPATAVTTVPGAGAGLEGMRERVGLAGGTLSAGPTAAGAFLLQVHLPWPAA